MTNEEMLSELQDIAASAELVKLRAISMIEKLGPIPAPAFKKSLSPEQVAKLRSDRLKSILKNQRKQNEQARHKI